MPHVHHRNPSHRRFPRSWARVRQLAARQDRAVAEPGFRKVGQAAAAGPFALARRLLARVSRLLLAKGAQEGERSATHAPGREARLLAVASKLEAILDELDELGVQRIAIDVCMALERLRERLAADDGEGLQPKQRDGLNTQV